MIPAIANLREALGAAAAAIQHDDASRALSQIGKAHQIIDVLEVSVDDAWIQAKDANARLDQCIREYEDKLRRL